MLPAIRWRHRRRRRFRNRVLAAMLLVALVPLLIFVAVVAADLGGVSGTTVDSANSAILDDAKQGQQRELDLAVGAVGAQVGQVANQVHGLRDSLAGALRVTATPADAAVATAPCYIVEAAACARGSSSTVVATGAPPPAGTAAKAGLLSALAVTAAVEPQMETALRAVPGARYVWVADSASGTVRVVPPVDVGQDVADGHLLTTGPINPAGEAPFSALAQSPADTMEQTSWGDEPSSVHAAAPDASFTATYPTGSPSGIGMTSWMQVEGTSYEVGVDVDVTQLLGATASQPVSDQPHAYSLLLDATGRILGGGEDAVADFGLRGSPWVGDILRPADPALQAQLGGLLATGQTSAGNTAHVLEATLGGQAKVILTSPVGGIHWVMASVVPEQPLLPRLPVLTRGIDSGVQRIFRDAILVAAGLCVLAFVLASLLARRVVGPVNALTASAERLGAGEMDVPVPAQGADEVGLLALNLERMRVEVNASRDGILAAARELEGRVAARTLELRERNEELVALNALAGSLTRSLDPQAMLEDALTTLRAVVPVVTGTAMALEGGVLVERASWHAEGAPGAGEELAAAARDAADGAGLTARPGENGLVVAVPLGTSDGVLGVIAVVARPGWRLEGRTRDLVRAIADQVGLALRTAALSAEGRELAVLEERTRLAREIHDTIAQQLTAIVLQLEAAEALVGRDESRARGVVVTARHLARSALHEARQSVWNLRPSSLDQTGLAGALTVEVRRWERRNGIPVHLRTAEVPREAFLAPQAEVALFRIAQEALANVAKHSGARRVDVRLEAAGDEVRLRIRDDGDGFEVDDDSRPDAFGLLGMEERARLAGAGLRITSEPGRGTEVEVRLPLSPAPAAEEAAPEAVATA